MQDPKSNSQVLCNVIALDFITLIKQFIGYCKWLIQAFHLLFIYFSVNDFSFSWAHLRRLWIAALVFLFSLCQREAKPKLFRLHY